MSRFGHRLLHWLGGGLAGAAILVVLLGWRVSQGPLELGPLTSQIQALLNYKLSHGEVEFSDAFVGWQSKVARPSLRVLNFRYKLDGKTVMEMPEAIFSLSGDGLLHGLIAPKSVEFSGLVVEIRRSAEGRIGFALQAPEIGGESAPSVGDDAEKNDIWPLLAGVLAADSDDRMPLSYLDTLLINQASVTLIDEGNNTVWRAPQTNLEFERTVSGLSGDMIGDLVTPAGQVSLAGSVNYNYQRQQADIDVSFSDVLPRTMLGNIAGFAHADVIDAPVNGSLGFTVEESGLAPRLTFNVGGGAGVVNLPDFYHEPLGLDEFESSGWFDLELQQVHLDKLLVQIPGGLLDIRGGIGRKDGAPWAELDVLLDKGAARDIALYWPYDHGQTGRDWVARNLGQGTVSDMVLKLNLQPGMLDTDPWPGEMLDLTFRFDGLSVDYLHPMPKMLNASGRGHLTMRDLYLQVESGEIPLDDQRTLEVRSAKVDLLGMRLDLPRADIDLTVAGQTMEVLDLIDHKPLRLPAKLGLNTGRIGGNAEATASLQFPLSDEITLEDVAVAVHASLTDTTINGALGGMRISNGVLTLSADRKSMRTVGSIKLNDQPLSLDWREMFEGKAEDGVSTSIYVLGGLIDQTGLAAFDIPTGDVVNGPLAVTFTINATGERINGTSALVDLTRAAVDASEIAWQKPVDEAAQLQFTTGPIADGRFAVREFSLSGRDMQAGGRIEFSSDNGLEKLNIASLRTGANDLSVTASRQGDGGYKLRLSGASFDFRPYLDDLFEDDESSKMSLDMDVRLRRVQLAEGVVLDGVFGEFVRDNGVWREMALDGALPEGKSLSMRMIPDGNIRNFVLTSDDAGAVVSGLQLAPTKFEGGSIAMTTRFDDSGGGNVGEGLIRMNDFRVKEAPILAQILTLGSLTGIGDILGGQGVGFKVLNIPLEYGDDLITIRKGRIFGPALGLTLDGEIDGAQDILALNGTIVPSYTLNSLLGKVPWVGDWLIGGEGGGVFAINYKIVGDKKAPKVTVNPLTALAPGFVRELLPAFAK